MRSVTSGRSKGHRYTAVGAAADTGSSRAAHRLRSSRTPSRSSSATFCELQRRRPLIILTSLVCFLLPGMAREPEGDSKYLAAGERGVSRMEGGGGCGLSKPRSRAAATPVGTQLSKSTAAHCRPWGPSRAPATPQAPVPPSSSRPNHHQMHRTRSIAPTHMISFNRIERPAS